MGDFKIGTTLVGMQLLSDIGLPDPKSDFLPYASSVITDSGRKKFIGTPVAIWNFGFLSYDESDVLRAYDTGEKVFLETPTRSSNDRWAVCKGYLHWPDEEPREPASIGYRIGIAISFHAIEIQSYDGDLYPLSDC